MLFNVGAQLLAPEACAEVLWLENAESGVGNVVTNASSYSLIQSAIVGQGDSAFRLASEGTALLWRSDCQNARHLLQALVRRVDRKPR